MRAAHVLAFLAMHFLALPSPALPCLGVLLCFALGLGAIVGITAGCLPLPHTEPTSQGPCTHTPMQSPGSPHLTQLCSGCDPRRTEVIKLFPPHL